MTEKYACCSTVPRTFVQDCSCIQEVIKFMHLKIDGTIIEFILFLMLLSHCYHVLWYAIIFL